MRVLALLLLLVSALALPVAAAEVVVAIVTQGAEKHDGAAEVARRMAALLSRDGLTLRVAAFDDPCDRAGSAAVAQRIAATNAQVIVGHVCAGSAAVAAPIYAAAGQSLVVTGQANGGKPVADALHLPASGETQGQYLGRQVSLLATQANARIAVVSDRTRWALTNIREASTALQAAGEAAVISETFAGGDKDFAAMSTRFVAAGVTHVVLAAFGSEAGLFVADLVKAAPDIVVVGTETLAGPEFARAAGSATANVLVALKPDIESLKSENDVARALLDGFGREHLRPSRTVLATAAAIEVIAAAARRMASAGGDVTPRGLGAALRDTSVPAQTVLGPVAFKADGQATVSAWRLHRWDAGRLTVVQR